MANVRINQLPQDLTPITTDVVPVDSVLGGTTRKVPLSNLADVIVPVPDEATAIAGANNALRMTPLRAKQQIDARLTDEATARARTDNASLTTPLRVTQLLAGDITSNPYAGPYENWRVGIGGIGYFDRKALASTEIRVNDGTMQVQAPFMYGDLDNATVMTNSAVSNRPGAILGLTDPSQVGGYNETGVTAHLAQADHVPVMHRTALGTYTSTTYTPATPFSTTSTLRVEIGMFVRTDASPSHQAQITAITRNGSDQVTSITTSGFFKTGESVASAPATDTPLLWNPMDKAWGRLVTTFLSALPVTYNATSGSTTLTITGSTVAGLKQTSPGHRISGPGIAAGTRITSISTATNQVFIWPAATSDQTAASGIVSLGTLYGAAFGDENDIFNAGPDFNYEYIRQSVGTTSGSYLVTVPDLTPWRVGLIVSGVPSDFPFANYVTELDFGGGAVRLKYPANATGTSAIVATNAIDEAGAAYVASSVLNRAQAGFISSGNWQNGYVANGGWNAGFLFRPGRESPRARWGFALDMRHNEFNTPTQGVLGYIDATGTERIVINPDGTAFNGVTLDADAWTAYTPTVAPTAGAFTTITARNGRYQKRGREVKVWFEFTLDNNGTGSGQITVTLPFNTQSAAVHTVWNATDLAVLSGQTFAANGFVMLQVPGGAYPGISGKTYRGAFTYESTT